MVVEAPTRVRHTYVQYLQAAAAEVFPLLCPVRECEWVEGWKPHAVYSYSGYAEAGCVFTTPEDDAEAIWVVTRHDPENHRIAFVKTTPGIVVTTIDIALREDATGGTEAEVSYTYTALSENGRAVVEAMTEPAYEQFMRAWETALNDYLRERPHR